MAQTTMYAGHVNSPYTLLSAAIDSDDTTIAVLELGVFPTAPNIATIGSGSDAETIYYGGKSAATGAGNLTSVTRGYNLTGTYGAAKSWTAGSVISRRFTEKDHASFKANIEDLDTYKIAKTIVDAKGDLIVATAADTVARLAVGTNTYPLVAKSAATEGIAWEQLTEAGIVLADNTTLDVSTTKHGLVPKLTAPAATYLNVPGIGNGETVLTMKTLFDATNPADLGTAGPGSSLYCARRDHVHTLPKLDDTAVPDDNTDRDVSTSLHGLCPKLTAPSSGYINFMGIGNGETALTSKELFTTTTPSDTGAAAAGTSLYAARIDHVHNVPKGGVISWTEITGASQQMAINCGYIANYSSLVTLTLPSTAALGTILRVAGKGAGFFKIAQNSGQSIRHKGTTTTTGTEGSLTSTDEDDSIELLCTTADTGWMTVNCLGTYTVA